MVQLVDEKGEIKYEKFGHGINQFDFNQLAPANYNLRVIHDTNGNQKFDTGNYLQKLQPEQVSYYPDVVEARGNWDFDYKFTLK